MAERAGELLRVDAERTIDALIERVRSVQTAAVEAASEADSSGGAGGGSGSDSRAEAAVRSSAKPTALMGLSGGLDSAVLATVVVRALGPQRLRLAYLYDHLAPAEGRANARAVAAKLGVPLEEVSIEADMRAAGVYDPPAVRLTSLSARLNRLLYGLRPMLTRGEPYVAAVRAEDPDARPAAPPGFIIRSFSLPVSDSFAVRSIHRRRVLEAEADRGGCFLLGGANRTEWLTGWFRKDGIDDLPEQPLVGLYKTQVRQLARELGVPEQVRQAAPSPDTLNGVTDEMGLGLPYGTLDIALDFLSGGVMKEQAIAAGVRARDVRHVERLLRGSAWKRRRTDGALTGDVAPTDVRQLRAMPPLPVDGGPRGGLRTGATRGDGEV
jgi:NAD+ synthase